MLHRPITRRSRAADTSRHAGALALPILGIAILGHRAFGMETEHAVALIATAVLLGLTAIMTAVFGAAIVWERGYRGGANAVRGFVYGLAAITPALFALWGSLSYPRLADVTTDVLDPPLYRASAFARAGVMNSTRPPTVDLLTRQRAAYPDIVTRRFEIGSEQLFTAAKKVVQRSGWTVLEETRPREDGERGRIEAEANTTIFGFADDVVLRILPESSGARLDIRSSSRFGTHDLGANARRIRAFLADLDFAVTESYGQ
jgi:hypothetical protein